MSEQCQNFHFWVNYPFKEYCVNSPATMFTLICAVCCADTMLSYFVYLREVMLGKLLVWLSGCANESIKMLKHVTKYTET